MIVSCWSVKGGSGTTVVAAGLALVAARAGGRRSLLVDLAGDAPAALGLDDAAGRGAVEWLDAVHTVAAPGGASWTSLPMDGPDVSRTAGDLAEFETRVDDAVSVLARGASTTSEIPEPAAVLFARRLAGDGRFVVVDAGTLPASEASPVAERLVADADRSLLVVRSCYLALRHVTRCARRIDGVVLIEEPGRSLGADDVAAVAGAPVVARVRCEPQVARVVDAGLLCSRMPRAVERAMLDIVEG
jgi:cellulose biosynthesis protein BcsQ